jgi:Skp family chaperone for outer membrane proteins
MELRVVDFEILTKNYKNYQDGLNNITNVKNDFIKSLDPIKNEMETIISQMSSGIIVDSKTQEQKEEKFRELQEKAMAIDENFKKEMKVLHDDLNKKTFDELSIIIDEYSKTNDIDVVFGKMEVVFLKEKFEITNDILEILKTKELFHSELSEEIEQINEESLEETTTETNN